MYMTPAQPKIREWLTRSLLKRGIWGSGLDTLLVQRVCPPFRAENGGQTCGRDMRMGGGERCVAGSAIVAKLHAPVGDEG